MAGTAPFFLQQLTDNDGKPLSNGKLYSWVGGSTNLPKALYYDKELTIPTSNPLICDASGILPQYFMASGFYKFEVKTSNDILIATRDYIESYTSTTTSGASGVSDHKLSVTINDTTADFLSTKIEIGDGLQSQVYSNSGSEKYKISSLGQVRGEAGSAFKYLNSFFNDSDTVKWTKTPTSLLASIPTSALGTVKIDENDNNGFLGSKIQSGSGVTINQSNPGEIGNTLEISNDGLVLFGPGDSVRVHVADNIYDSNTIKWRKLGINNTTRLYADVISPFDGKIKYDSNDISGYLGTKIKAGSGISFTTTSDTTGTIIWVNSKTNLWTPLKYIQVLNYTVIDTDATLVVGNGPDYDNGLPVTEITLPTPSSLYAGRVIVIRGSKPQAGWHITNPASQQMGASAQTTGIPTTVYAGYARTAWTCLLDAASESYKWILDVEFA